MAHVRILHNKNERESFFEGYKATDPLVCVFDGYRDLKGPDTAVAVFVANQHDGGVTPWYKGRRALSVGDVIMVDGKAFAVERVGFKEIDPPSLF